MHCFGGRVLSEWCAAFLASRVVFYSRCSWCEMAPRLEALAQGLWDGLRVSLEPFKCTGLCCIRASYAESALDMYTTCIGLVRVILESKRPFSRSQVDGRSG